MITVTREELVKRGCCEDGLELYDNLFYPDGWGAGGYALVIALAAGAVAAGLAVVEYLL
ncbi:MAG: hypothetical protein JRL30_00845 [Deltaproteobacteria bacterium]|nr:hypothetical protein [Deltaproteobacteria bacterium]